MTKNMASQAAQYTHLGRSGLKVSNLCLGTMTFGKQTDSSLQKTFPQWPTQVEQEGSFAIMDRYVELGGNFLDSANVYNRGVSERLIGSWLQKQDRDKMIIATKCRFNMGDGPNDKGLSRRHIMQMCNDSLERLQTDYIDLYQTHLWDSTTPIEETLRALDDLVRCGKVRYLGVSNVCGWQMQKIVSTIKEMGLTNVVSLQQQYNLLNRFSELEEFQVCRNEGIGVLPWSPLSGGKLTGKFQRGVIPDPKESRTGHSFAQEKSTGSSFLGWSNYADNDQYWNLIDTMRKIATKHERSVPQVAIRWLLQKNVVSSVIIGATSIKQLEDNMAAGIGWNLSNEEMEELDKASEQTAPYPYSMLKLMDRDQNKFYPSPCVQNIQES